MGKISAIKISTYSWKLRSPVIFSGLWVRGGPQRYRGSPRLRGWPPGQTLRRRLQLRPAGRGLRLLRRHPQWLQGEGVWQCENIEQLNIKIKVQGKLQELRCDINIWPLDKQAELIICILRLLNNHDLWILKQSNNNGMQPIMCPHIEGHFRRN